MKHERPVKKIVKKETRYLLCIFTTLDNKKFFIYFDNGFTDHLESFLEKCNYYEIPEKVTMPDLYDQTDNKKLCKTQEKQQLTTLIQKVLSEKTFIIISMID